MKSIKKCLAFALCISLMFTLITSTSDAQTYSTYYDYTSVSESLLKIGVLKELKQDLNAMVTRGELAQMVSPLVADFSSVSYDSIFSDVSSENNFADDIYILSMGKVMNGYSDGTFRPDNHVAMNEALKIFTTLLGYGPVAERWGGYPTAYVRAAHESKLTKNVNAYGDEPITYGEAVQLLYNTVTADMLQVTGVSKDGLTIERYSGKSLLTEHFDIYQYEGVLEATGITSVTGGKTISKGSILVGKQQFRVAEDEDYSEFLGYYVKCYYTGSGSDSEAVLLVKDYNRNEEILISSQDIENVEKSGDITISYRTQDGKIKKQRIDAYADLIYNGKAYPAFSYTDLMIKSGHINLINNDTDSEIDVISVTEFDTVVVKGVSKSEQKVYGVYAADETGATGINLDADELEKVKIINSAGAECTIDDIMKDNVLSVARSKDNEVVLCIVESLGIIGTISALENDGQEIAYCVVNDNKYKLTEELTKLIKTAGEQKTNFVLGESLRFAITHDGKIAYSFKTESGEQYGYLLEAKYGARPIKPDEGEFLIYSQKGELLQVKGAKKIKTNSGSGKSAKEAITEWDVGNNAGITNNGEVIQQLVKYRLNDKGELDKLYYATQAGDEVTYDYKNERFYKADITESPYRISTSSIGEYTISDETPIFVIAKRDADGRVESDGINIVPLSFFNDQVLNFLAYDFDAYKAPKVVVIDSSDNSDRSIGSDDAFVLQKKKTIINEDEEEKCKLVGLMNGASKEYIVSDNIAIFDINGDKTTMTLDDLEEGDAFMVTTNVNGELTQLMFACDISNDLNPEYRAIRFPKSSTGSYGNSVCSAVVGNVADYTFNAIGVRTYDINTDMERVTGHSIVNASHFYLYDTSEAKSNRVKTVTKDELIAEASPGDGSRVVVISRYTATRAVIIIK